MTSTTANSGTLTLSAIRAGNQQLVGEDLLAGVEPVAVAVPVEPGIELGQVRGRVSQVTVIDVREAGNERSVEDHAVLVVGIAERIGVVAGGRAIGLAVGFGIDGGAEMEASDDDVPGAVVGQRGRIVAGHDRILGRIAEVEFVAVTQRENDIRRVRGVESAAGARVCRRDVIELVRRVRRGMCAARG